MEDQKRNYKEDLEWIEKNAPDAEVVKGYILTILELQEEVKQLKTQIQLMRLEYGGL